MHPTQEFKCVDMTYEYAYWRKRKEILWGKTLKWNNNVVEKQKMAASVSLLRKLKSLPLCAWFGSRRRNLRSDAALEAIAKASEDKVPNLVVYNYPTFSGAFSALFAHLFHIRHNLPALILPFSSVPFLSLRFSVFFCSLISFLLLMEVLCFLFWWSFLRS